MTETVETTERLFGSVPDACRISGLTRTHVYDAMARGELRARKAGRRTLVEIDSLRRYMGSLPEAKFGAARRAN